MPLFLKTLQLERCVTVVGLLCMLSNQAWSASNRSPIEGCIRQSYILTCTGTIPPHVPHGIREVTLLEINGIKLKEIITERLFCNPSWSAIERLWISDGEFQARKYYLYDNMFECLGNLTTLKLKLPRLDTALPNNTFVGLDKVTTLDMSNCVHLSPTLLFKALSDSKNLPNLENIVLHEMNTINDETNEFTKEMFQSLAHGRNIIKLDMSNTRLSYRFWYTFTQQLCQTLKVLNVSGVRLIQKSSPTDNLGNIFPCYSLETVDVSRSRTAYNIKSETDVPIMNANIELTYDMFPWAVFLNTIKTLYSSNAITMLNGKYAYIHNSMLNISVLYNLKHVDMSNNRLKYIDGVCVSEYIRLESLDLSQNDMEYVTPRFFQPRMIISLRRLDVSHNMLWHMETNQTEFETMFTKLIHLEVLNLSHNNLSKIPKRIFAQNKNIHHLDMSNNKLTHVNFVMEHLINLNYLDISGNSLVNLDSNTIRMLNHLFATQTNKSVNLKVNLHGNPLQCSTCSNLEFAKWMTTSPIIANNHQGYVCETEIRAQIPIDRDVVSDIHHICDRPIILRRTILLATLIPTAAIIMLVITIRYAVKLVRKKHEHSHVEEIRRKIENNEYKFKYPVFLSYSSLDDDIVLNHLYEVLHHQLRAFCSTDKELVCIGDRHFRAGRYIFDEVSRCLEMSALLVVVMSTNYCHSDWCIAEMQQAYQHHKQMMLIFIEDVEEVDMPPIVREHFRKRVRVKFFSTDDGDYEILPEWDTVCSSIIGMLP